MIVIIAKSTGIYSNDITILVKISDCFLNKIQTWYYSIEIKMWIVMLFHERPKTPLNLAESSLPANIENQLE